MNVMHSYTAEERRSFSTFINQKLLDPSPASTLSGPAFGLGSGVLSPNVRSKYLPINPESEELFQKVKDGVLLCAFINKIRAGTIPERKIIEQPRNHFEQLQNCTAVLNAGRELGLNIVNIGPEDIIAGKPHLILGLVWQLVRLDLVSSVTVSKHPEIVALIEPTEDVKSFVELTPEVNLLRWFNHHLKALGSDRNVTNFSRDLQDCENYVLLLSSIAPSYCDIGFLNRERDVYRRAQFVIDSAVKLGCSRFITPEDIVNGNWKLNLAFVAELFHKRNALHLNEEQNAKLREVEELLRVKLRDEEAEMRKRIHEEEQRMRAELQKAEEEHRKRLSAQEAELRQRLEAERSKPGMEARNNFAPVAPQTESYTSSRRFSSEAEPIYPGATSTAAYSAASSSYNNAPPRPPPLQQQHRSPSYEGIPSPPPVPPAGFVPAGSVYEREGSGPIPVPSPISNPPQQAGGPQRIGATGAASFNSGSFGSGSRIGSGSYAVYQATASTSSGGLGGVGIVSSKQVYEMRTSGYTGQAAGLSSSGSSVGAPPPPSNFIQSPESVYQPPPILRTDSFRGPAPIIAQAPPPPAPSIHQPAMAYPPPPPQHGHNSVAMGMHSGMQSGGIGYASAPGGMYGGGSAVGGQYGSSSGMAAGYIQFQGRFPIRVLKVYIYEARRIAKKDLMGLLASDPYVVVERKGGMRKTRACKNTTRPVWYEEFEFPYVDDSEHIYITVWDQDKFGKDDFLGQVVLTKEDLVVDGERWFPLRSRPGSHDRVSGEIRIGLRSF